MKNTSLSSVLIFACLSLSSFAIGAEEAAKPKYGPEAIPVSRQHEYFRTHEAPDYWALSPYYVPQRDGKSCSIASVTIVMNALRSKMNLTADDELLTQDSLLGKAGGTGWKSDLGWFGRGVTLDHLGKYIEEALSKSGLVGYSVETVHADTTPAAAKKLHDALVENEKSTDDFIIANFSQGIYTGDTGGGHISPIGAYDAAKKRVLVMDVDRQWYEPYWVSEESFLKGMATPDSESKLARGYVWIRKTAH